MRRNLLVLPATIVAGSAIVTGWQPAGESSPEPVQAPPSTWSGTVKMDPNERHGTESDGDLWPSCWADDGNLYAAWGDGKGFDLDGAFSDIGVARITGEPGDLRGENLAQGDEVGPIWAEAGYNRKPTGMVCVGDTIHLAVQDLALDFNDVPNATIVTSTDGGQTWDWDGSAPMFADHTFTTMWFADFGQGGEWSIDDYVYVYGLDNNWRDSFNDRVDDPTDVYLARVPRDKVADRAAWQFYVGTKGNGKALWSKKIDERQPVIHDTRRVYQQMFNPDWVHDMTVLSQGHVLYNKPLDRYLYSSWTEYTLEMYESPTPWGPWSRMESHDFGGYPWGPEQHAGYGATMPSKFLSEDGRTLMLQSNVCPCAPSGNPVYRYSLRQVELAPAQGGEPSNELDGGNVASPESGVVAVSKSVRQGDRSALNDGSVDVSLDDSDEELKRDSWWGYTWPEPKRMNRVVYTTGEVQDDGGWFLGRPRVQVRQDGRWVDVDGQATDPVYPGRRSVGSTQEFTVTFPETVGDGVRVIGVPGGDLTYSSMSEIEVHYDLALIDGGFEGQRGFIGAPWAFEGDAARGIDGNGSHSRTGAKNAWVRTFEPLGTQLLTQTISVEPGTTLDVSAWTRTSEAVETVRLGVRYDGGEQIETFDGTSEWEYTRRETTFTVPDGMTQATVVVGYDADGGDAVLQVDDVAVEAIGD